eukprot:690615-Prorocentrum_minimum.AAC.1
MAAEEYKKTGDFAAGVQVYVEGLRANEAHFETFDGQIAEIDQQVGGVNSRSSGVNSKWGGLNSKWGGVN